MADTKCASGGEILLTAGQSATWWWTWEYINPWRWVNFSVNAVSDGGKVEITKQWSERDALGNQKWLTTFKNIGSSTTRVWPFVVCIKP